MFKKVLSVFLSIVFMGVLGSNVFAEEEKELTLTQREWDNLLIDRLHEYDVDVLNNTNLMDILFSDKRSQQEKYRAARIFADFVILGDHEFNEISKDIFNGSDNFLYYFARDLNDDYVKVALSWYLDTSIFDIYIELIKEKKIKEVTFADVVAMTYILGNRLFGKDKVTSVEIHIAERIKGFLLGTSWYQQRKDTENVKKILGMLNSLITEKQDRETISNFYDEINDIYATFTEQEKSKQVDDKKISFEEYLKDEMVNTLIEKGCPAYKVMGMFFKVLDECFTSEGASGQIYDENFNLERLLEVLLEKAKIGGNEVESLLSRMPKEWFDRGIGSDMSEDFVYILLSKLDPRADKENMMRNIHDLVKLLVSDTEIDPETGKSDVFSAYDVSFLGGKDAFGENFSNTMIKFFKMPKVDLILASIFVGYIIKSEDMGTAKVVLESIQASEWFKDIDKHSELKAQIEKLQAKINCMNLFMKEQ